ncbi:MAG: CAP domain-containing protein [Flavobacteriaceae bacterium]|nr:CAP domain-containing protein [Flavobacteriaceae bacterium]
MKTTIKILALVFIAISFTACSKDDDGFETLTATETVNITGLETEILALVNIHRETLGLTRVSVLTPAYTEASGHTKYMIDQGKISHDNFEVRSRNLMTTANAKVVLENVGAGYTTAESLMNAWLNSELHRKNIENPSVQFMGVSAKQNATGSNYYTQIFIGR